MGDGDSEDRGVEVQERSQIQSERSKQNPENERALELQKMKILWTWII